MSVLLWVVIALVVVNVIVVAAMMLTRISTMRASNSALADLARHVQHEIEVKKAEHKAEAESETEVEAIKHADQDDLVRRARELDDGVRK